jgi:hypothetical protein
MLAVLRKHESHYRYFSDTNLAAVVEMREQMQGYRAHQI